MDNPSELSKLALFEKVAAVLKAMGDPVRLILLHQLQAGEMCVGKLVEGLSCSQANVSKHLAVLKQAGLVSSHREGNKILYAISDAAVFDICSVVGGSIKRRLSAEQVVMDAAMRQLQSEDDTQTQASKQPAQAVGKAS